jgi:nucleoside-diphosphate-sugar epimerase
MKILITGGAGYIGGYLTDHLVAQGHDITVYDNLLFEARFLKDIPFINGDIRDYAKLGPLVNDYDVVIWLAGIVGDGASSVNPGLTKELNTDTVVWLANNFKGQIIFPSSCSVYGKNDQLIDETAEPAPLSIYASTKLAAEQYLLLNRPDALIYRLGTLFGLSDTYSRLRLDLVSNILSMKAANKETLSIFGGQQWRPLLHVRDVSTAISHALEYNTSGLFNLSYKNYKLSEIAEEIVKLVPGSNLNYCDLQFEDMRNYKVMNDKILATGWKPIYTLEFGIMQIIRVIRENRIKNPLDPIYSNAAYIKQLGDF